MYDSLCLINSYCLLRRMSGFFFFFFFRLYDMLWRLCQVCVWKWCIMTRDSLVKHTHIFNVIHFMQSVNFIMRFPPPIALSLSISCKRLLHITINYVLIFCLLTCTYSGQICHFNFFKCFTERLLIRIMFCLHSFVYHNTNWLVIYTSIELWCWSGFTVTLFIFL